MLGPFALFAPSGARVAIPSRKSVALLSLVAMARAGERDRAWLQNHLWSNRPVQQGRASLRRELANLRTQLVAADAGHLLETCHSRVRLNLVDLIVDVRELERELAATGGATSAVPDELLEGIDLPGEEPFEDWLREQRLWITEVVGRASREARARQTPGVAKDSGSAAPSCDDAPVAMHVRPSVAVLRLSSACDILADAVGEGITDEIGVALSRFSTLSVVRGGLPPPAKCADRAQLCRELKVRYLLEGGIQRCGGDVRVNVRLIDGVAGEQVWAERFDGNLAELFAFQDRIGEAVSLLVDASIEQAERQKAVHGPLAPDDACRLYWRASALLRSFDRDSIVQAARLAEQVLDVEPDNAWASSLAAFCHAISWADDAATARARALALHEHAMRHGGNDPVVLGYAAGTILALSGDVALADHHIERALKIQPRSATTLFWGGWVDLAAGRTARGLLRFEAALGLHPRSGVRPLALTGMGLCLLLSGRYDDAVVPLLEAEQHLPGHGPIVAARALALLGTGRRADGMACLQQPNAVGGVTTIARFLRSAPHVELLATLLAPLRIEGEPNARGRKVGS
ncbi:MAG: hypothetical protein PGN12_09395 [Sphingomonas phyllosphaerae]